VAKLEKASVGDVWLTLEEVRLREELARLPGLARNVVSLQNELDERIQQNRLTWETNQVRIAQLKQLKASLKPDEIKRRRIDEQIQELEGQAVAPEELGTQADVRTRLIDLSNERNRLALGVLTVRRLEADLEPTYARLAKDRQVTGALAALGAGHRLGPLGDGYQSEIRRLPEYDKYAFTDWVPLYRQSGRWRVAAILNEQTPVAFTWLGSFDPTTLTTSMAEAAGVCIPSDATAVQLPVGQSRIVTARAVQVGSLRFGAHVFRDLSVLVLPPEAEDLGAQLGMDAFDGYVAREQPDRLRLLITSNGTDP